MSFFLDSPFLRFVGDRAKMKARGNPEVSFSVTWGDGKSDIRLGGLGYTNWEPKDATYSDASTSVTWELDLSRYRRFLDVTNPVYRLMKPHMEAVTPASSVTRLIGVQDFQPLQIYSYTPYVFR